MHATLEHMTIWSLISDATPLVKGVMLTLLLASLTSWYLIVQRSLLLGRSERLLKQFQQQFRASADLAQLYREGGATADDDAGLERIFRDGFGEFSHLKSEPGISGEAVIDGVERRLLVTISEEQERLEKGLAFLATVGSTAPLHARPCGVTSAPCAFIARTPNTPSAKNTASARTTRTGARP